MRNEKESIHEALFELKSLQDLISDSSTKHFGKLLGKMVGVDTIPFTLSTQDGLISHMGVEINNKTEKEESFSSNYFRIESIDKEGGYASFLLLRPLDIYGNDAHSHRDVFKLKKTSARVDIDLSCINEIQPVDVHFLKREIIIEPKW